MIVGERFAYTGCVACGWFVYEILENLANIIETFLRRTLVILNQRLDRDQLLPVFDSRACLPDGRTVVSLPHEL
jgi:hypothetical protein